MENKTGHCAFKSFHRRSQSAGEPHFPPQPSATLNFPQFSHGPKAAAPSPHMERRSAGCCAVLWAQTNGSRTKQRPIRFKKRFYPKIEANLISFKKIKEFKDQRSVALILKMQHLKPQPELLLQGFKDIWV